MSDVDFEFLLGLAEEADKEGDMYPASHMPIESLYPDAEPSIPQLATAGASLCMHPLMQWQCKS